MERMMVGETRQCENVQRLPSCTDVCPFRGMRAGKLSVEVQTVPAEVAVGLRRRKTAIWHPRVAVAATRQLAQEMPRHVVRRGETRGSQVQCHTGQMRLMLALATSMVIWCAQVEHKEATNSIKAACILMGEVMKMSRPFLLLSMFHIMSSQMTQEPSSVLTGDQCPQIHGLQTSQRPQQKRLC